MAAAAAWTWLSFGFVYGQDHAQRPILWFLAVYLAAWLAWIPLGFPRFLSRGPGVGAILLVAALARLILVPSHLIQENDVYRYVLDGQVVLSGENPYRYSPAELSVLTYHPLKTALEEPQAQIVLDRIGYPEIPTIYPPAAQAAFAAGSLLGGWDWRGQRVVFLFFDAGCVLLLWALMRPLGAPTQAVALYAWNPLVLKEVANSGHVDSLAGFFLIAALAAAAWAEAGDQEGKRRLAVLLPAASGALLAVAVLSKLYPLILAPSLTWFFLRRRGLRTAAGFAASLAAVCALGYAWFVDVGLETLFAGLKAYGLEWRMNEGLFELLALAPVNPRIAAAAIIALVALLLPWRWPAQGLEDLIAQCLAILTAWFLLLPAAFPWYALPLVALAALLPDYWVSRGVWVLSGVIAAYYLSFYVDYHNLSPSWWAAVRGVEYCVILTALAWFRRTSRPPENLSAP